MPPLAQLEVWFATGSQRLYGEQTLRAVADHSRQIAALDAAPAVVVWMHAFSPAKMWIVGLLAPRKPLLAMAEITNELSGPTGAAKGYPTQVMDRGGVTAKLPALGTKEAFRQVVLDERGRELYYEFGIRRQDLILNCLLINNVRARGLTNVKDNQGLFPIPVDVII